MVSLMHARRHNTVAIILTAAAFLLLLPLAYEILVPHGPGTEGTLRRLIVVFGPIGVTASVAAFIVAVWRCCKAFCRGQRKESLIAASWAILAMVPISLVVLFLVSIAVGLGNLGG